jgi:hypothetical protein
MRAGLPPSHPQVLHAFRLAGGLCQLTDSEEDLVDSATTACANSRNFANGDKQMTEILQYPQSKAC